MGIDSKDFKVKEGKNIDLKKWPTQIGPFYKSQDQYKDILQKHLHALRSRQEVLYASDQYALLIVFQGMDGAGKDSAIEHVMSGVNPQGCQVSSFKQPSSEELDHDFLWRANQRLPERGKIGIFNRSYYEEVLVVRVHPHLLDHQNIPEELLNKKTIWDQRYHSIRNWEKHLFLNGTKIIKIFLHISKEEQRRRFLKRIEQPEKNWKFNPGDLKEREYWKDYMRAYADCLSATSTAFAPWYVVPADDKENARLIISQVILDALDGIKMSYPKLSPRRLKELQFMRESLSK